MECSVLTSGQVPLVWLGVITTLVVTKNAPFSAEEGDNKEHEHGAVDDHEHDAHEHGAVDAP